MIPTYSKYINLYMSRDRKFGHLPGEHHFVAVYLVPKLFEICRTVPDYINPDGTKAVFGDVVYTKESGNHHFGIEVKLKTARLTKREFNDWIVEKNGAHWPNVFIGVGSKGVAVTSWMVFREAYVKAVSINKGGWIPSRIEKGYGPSTSVDILAKHLPPDTWFQFDADDASDQSVELEGKLIAALKELLKPYFPLNKPPAFGAEVVR